MLTPHILITFSVITASSAVQMPVHEVLTLVDAELNTLDFIRLSFQPLLITDALQRTTLDRLAPWTFPALCSSLEAATTFCIASTGPLRHFDGVGEVVDQATEGYDEEVPMSLRRFCMEGPGNSSLLHAFTTFTKELGTAVILPGVLKDADLAFLDLAKTGVRHSRVGWTEQGLGESAVVVCVVEGILSLALTPLPPSVATLQCVAGHCEATVKSHQEQDVPLELSFLTRATAHPRACLYSPPGWQWSAAALQDSTFLLFTWENDLVIKDNVVEKLFPEENTKGCEGTRQRRKAGTPTMWEALPKGSSPPSLLLWGDQNPLLHLIRRYLLSDRHLSLESFLQEFRVDRLLMPDLVDCSNACITSAVAIFELMDADADGELTPADATHLTHASFTSITHQMDDFMDELKDFAREQWEEVLEGPAEARSAFLQRAKDRLTASATATVQRWVAGDLEGVDDEALKEHLPSLHERIFAAKESAVPQDKDEL